MMEGNTLTESKSIRIRYCNKDQADANNWNKLGWHETNLAYRSKCLMAVVLVLVHNVSRLEYHNQIRLANFFNGIWNSGASIVELCKEVGKTWPLESPEIRSWKEHFCLKIFVSQRIFYWSEKPRSQHLSLCIPFPNQNVFDNWTKGYCFILCKTCWVFIGTSGSTHACHTCHCLPLFEKQKNNHVNWSVILDDQYLLCFLTERIFCYKRKIDCSK